LKLRQADLQTKLPSQRGSIGTTFICQLQSQPQAVKRLPLTWSPQLLKSSCIGGRLTNIANIMPFHSRSKSHDLSSGFLSATGAIGAIASPNLMAASNTSHNNPQDSSSKGAHNDDAIMDHSQSGRSLDPSTPMSAPPDQQQQHNTPRRQYQPTYQDPPPSTGSAPSFSVQPSTPGSSHSSSVVPSSTSSRTGLPGALQPGGSSRPTSSSYTAPLTIPSMSQPLPSNAQHYAQASQPPSRSGTLQSHSRSPSGLDGTQKYIPFNQTPTQTPNASNPKAYNLSNAQTPSAGPSHSPLNLTDIRSRAISDANEGPQGTAFFSYSDSPQNSNYLAPFPTYAFDWCKWPAVSGSGAGKMAIGSYLEDPHNFIQILDTHITPQETTAPGQAPYGLEYTKVAEATCAYPVTRILWEPPSSQKQSTDLLATSGDHLRLWSLPQSTTPHVSSNINRSATANLREPAPQKLQPLALLSNSKTPEHTAPLTSLDWNTLSPKLIITSSIDTTCTIWDIPTLTAKTQLIAHDKEVFDVRFCAGSVDVFVSCGADGSVRMFDLRSLEHSTIIYEPADKSDKCRHISDQSSLTLLISYQHPPPLHHLHQSRPRKHFHQLHLFSASPLLPTTPTFSQRSPQTATSSAFSTCDNQVPPSSSSAATKETSTASSGIPAGEECSRQEATTAWCLCGIY
jgi:WD repeat-containing protein 68